MANIFYSPDSIKRTLPSVGRSLNEAFTDMASMYKPQKAAEDLLNQRLVNAINKPKADNADEWFRAELGNKNALTGLSNSLTNKRSNEAQEFQILNDWLKSHNNKTTKSNESTWGVDNQGNRVKGTYEQPGVEEEEEEEEYGEPEAIEPESPYGHVPPHIRALAEKHGIKLGYSPVLEARYKADAAAHSKEAQEVLDDAKSLLNKGYSIEGIAKLLEKNRNLTGMLPWLENKLGFGGESLGEFSALAGPLQAELGKDISSRGGQAAYQFAAAAKPDIWESGATNIGRVGALKDKIKQGFDIDKKRYEELTHKKFPLKLSDYFNNKNKEITKEYKGKTYRKINGEWYE